MSDLNLLDAPVEKSGARQVTEKAIGLLLYAANDGTDGR